MARPRQRTIRETASRSWSFLLVLATVAGSAAAQDIPIAHRRVELENPTPHGSKSLDAVVYYPAAAAGEEAIAAREGGHPVVVLLHGYGGTGANYRGLGEHLARAGYVAVLSATARVEPLTQAQDGAGLFAALTRANAEPGSPWRGALDMQRAALCGHSMGGGNTLRVLADNPGYRCGFCFAPWDGRLPLAKRDYVSEHTPRVKVPVAIAHGTGDRILAWRTTGKRHYDALALPPGNKALWLLDDTCTHMNVALRARAAESASRAAFEQVAAIATAWFDKHLKGEEQPYAALVEQARGGEMALLRQLLIEEGAPSASEPRR